MINKRCVTLVIILLMTIAGTINAQHSKRVKQLESQRKAMQEQIRQTNTLIQKTSNTTKSALRRLSLLSQQIETRKKMIETLGNEIAVSDTIIASMQTSIDSLQGRFDSRQKNYVKSLQAMQNKDMAQESLLFILSSQDVDQGLRRARYLKEYAEWQKGEAIKLREMKEEIEAKQKEMEAQRQQKLSLLSLKKSESEELKASEEEGKKTIQELKKKKTELLKQLAVKQRQERQLNQQIEQQIAKEIAAAQEKARREAEARRAQAQKDGNTSQARKAETTGGYAMTGEEYKLSSTFSKNKGSLPPPITGRFVVAERFGEHSHDAFSNIKVNNYGVNLRGSSDAKALAVFDGVVTRIFVVEGFNNSIIIRHGNYLTVYSNISDVYVKTGERVSTGDQLGKIYSDPDMGGATVLHFQVWKERNKLNPLLWIRH